MISNQILQSTIEGIKNISRVELCVADVDGKEIVSTSSMGDCVKAVGEFALSPADSQEIQGKQYFKIYDEQQLEYILIVSGVGEDVYTVGKMATFHIQGLLVQLCLQLGGGAWLYRRCPHPGAHRRAYPGAHCRAGGRAD